MMSFSQSKFEKPGGAFKTGVSSLHRPLPGKWFVLCPACSLLGASPGSSNLSVVAALKPFPNMRSSEELLRLEGKQDAASQESFGLLVDAAVPLALTFALPLLVSTVTLEKEHKLRSLMVMMGLRMRWYWLCEWLTNTFIQLLVSLVLFVTGAAVGLPFITQSRGVWVLLTLEWIQVMPAMAMLLSAFYSKLLVSSVVTQLLVIILVAVSLILNRFTYNGPGDTFATPLFLIAPLAYYRAIHLLLRRPYLLSTLAGEMRTIVLMLAIDAGLYATLAAYFDAVLPREFGVVQPPLFFLQLCLDVLSRRQLQNGRWLLSHAREARRDAACPLLGAVVIAYLHDGERVGRLASCEGGEIEERSPSCRNEDPSRRRGRRHRKLSCCLRAVTRVEDATVGVLHKRGAANEFRRARVETQGSAAVRASSCPGEEGEGDAEQIDGFSRDVGVGGGGLNARR